MLGAACVGTGARVLAWALLPNHWHLVRRRGKTTLAQLMRRLLTGYSVSFNRRHQPE